ncbi:hypothetical protein E3T55_18755 [Cryobacterium frigoriphilum]|uniref:Uncharacterized protein n=1 Tax=Cryobacterium frigoriphilum TaxID=1259150 RepID=A0A4R8ZTM3_9MICO|nr:hypothetical protein [Cryobacterium frigoriphilum]TFD45377.1 hypothetical protein E3T55_18755 [Cryobacterium frigoriphilum]
MGMNAFATGTNWDTFYPDLIVGAVTGVAVGFVLLAAQAISLRRRGRADSTFAWESLKPAVSGAAHRSWLKDFDSLLPIPLPLLALDDIASRWPLALWQSHLKKSDPVLDSLLVITRLRPHFESCAVELESALVMDSIQFLEQTWMADQNIWRIIRARAYGEQDSAAHETFIGVQNVELIAYTRGVDHLLTLPRLKVAMARYQDAADSYLISLTRLRQLLTDDEV